MPSGERVVRRFQADKEIEELYAFVECYDELTASDSELRSTARPEGFKHEYSFRLVSPLPREVISLEDGGTIEGRIGRSGN